MEEGNTPANRAGDLNGRERVSWKQTGEWATTNVDRKTRRWRQRTQDRKAERGMGNQEYLTIFAGEGGGGGGGRFFVFGLRSARHHLGNSTNTHNGVSMPRLGEIATLIISFCRGGNTYTCFSRSIAEIHLHVAGMVQPSNQQTDKPHSFLFLNNNNNNNKELKSLEPTYSQKPCPNLNDTKCCLTDSPNGWLQLPQGSKGVA